MRDIRIVSVVKRSRFLELLRKLYEELKYQDRYGNREV